MDIRLRKSEKAVGGSYTLCEFGEIRSNNLELEIKYRYILVSPCFKSHKNLQPYYEIVFTLIQV